MYNFKEVNIKDIDKQYFYSNPQLVPFGHIEWIEFIKELKGVRPVVLEISESKKSRVVGFFIGGITKLLGVKILGSPFWGWMGQHMGFSMLVEVNKANLVDDLIDFAFEKLKVGYVQMCDFNISFEDISNCTHKLIPGEQYTTCYIDLTLPEETLQKNLKSGYRTSIRKFAKDGGYIVEDYSEEFIEEHHRQLEQVFVRNNLKTPDYRKKMSMLLRSPDFIKGVGSKLGVYFIKAMLPVEENGKIKDLCIATSYYILNGYMAMFASNASYTQYLRSCPNQALSWHAMMKFKKEGLHYLDMGGSGSYKLNFSGGGWQPRPIIICSKNKYNYLIILGLKRNFGKVYRLFGKYKVWVKSKLLKEKGFGLKETKMDPSKQ